MFNVVDQWRVVVKTYETREDAESYISRNEKLHLEEAE